MVEAAVGQPGLARRCRRCGPPGSRCPRTPSSPPPAAGPWSVRPCGTGACLAAAGASVFDMRARSLVDRRRAHCTGRPSGAPPPVAAVGRRWARAARSLVGERPAAPRLGRSARHVVGLPGLAAEQLLVDLHARQLRQLVGRPARTPARHFGPEVGLLGEEPVERRRVERRRRRAARARPSPGRRPDRRAPRTRRRSGRRGGGR